MSLSPALLKPVLLKSHLANLAAALVSRLPYPVQHWIDVASASLEAERARIQVKARSREALEFLPAALEVTESPPSPKARVLAGLLISLFTIGLSWSIIGHVDVVATAEGKIVPSRYTKVVQPLEAGVVRAIHVRDGDHVTEGQVLIELDPTQATADKDSLIGQLDAAKTETARFTAEMSPTPMAAFAPPPNVPKAVSAQNRRLLEQEISTQQSKLAGLDSEIRRNQADLEAWQVTVEKLEKSTPMLRERVETKRGLAGRFLATRHDLLQLEQQLVEQEQDLIIQRHRVDQAHAALESARQQRGQAQADFFRNVLSQQEDTEKKIAQIAQELAKAEQRRGLQTLTAPITGVVQELSIHSEGGVVQPAEKLLSVVPDNSGLEIDAQMPNRDIGFVVEGQEAEIKLDAFPHTSYGTIPGHVAWISRDAIKDDKLGLLYPVRVALDRTSIDAGDRVIPLGPGLSATVEIKTEKRRVISYLLSPLARYRHDAMRER
jgi:hemolysin D